MTTTCTKFSTVASAGILDPGDIDKVVFSQSTVFLAAGDGATGESRLIPHLATIRYPISPADMPQVEVSELQLHINYMLATGRVVATLTEVAYWLHPTGLVSHAGLLAFSSDGDTAAIQNPNVYVSSTAGALEPTPFPPGNHVCDSTKNAYYIELQLSQPGPNVPTPPVLFGPSVSAIWLTNV
jgi:archaellum component FlaG (FlaF/FlaG flagellin family)